MYFWEPVERRLGPEGRPGPHGGAAGLHFPACPAPPPSAAVARRWGRAVSGAGPQVGRSQAAGPRRPQLRAPRLCPAGRRLPPGRFRPRQHLEAVLRAKEPVTSLRGRLLSAPFSLNSLPRAVIGERRERSPDANSPHVLLPRVQLGGASVN